MESSNVRLAPEVVLRELQLTLNLFRNEDPAGLRVAVNLRMVAAQRAIRHIGQVPPGSRLRAIRALERLAQLLNAHDPEAPWLGGTAVREVLMGLRALLTEV